MRPRDAEMLAGGAITVIVVLVAVPVALGATGSVVGPLWLWWSVFAVHLVSVVATQWFGELLPGRLLPVGLAVLVGSTATLVALAPGAGWVAILLVFSAAICAYFVPTRVVWGVVALNVTVLAVSLAVVVDDLTALLFSVGIYALLHAASVWSVHSQLRERRLHLEVLVANTDLRAAQALLAETSRTEERLRIARELHDVVGHQLTGLSLELEIAAHLADGEALDHVARARTAARSLLTDVREAVGEQRALAPDLATALRRVVADQPELQVGLEVRTPEHVDAAVVHTFVRCAQEVVTNTLRHSHADQLWIEVRQEDEELVLDARDDGTAPATVRAGHGLTGIEERVAALGGRLDYAGGDGFRLTARVPMT